MSDEVFKKRGVSDESEAVALEDVKSIAIKHLSAVAAETLEAK